MAFAGLRGRRGRASPGFTFIELIITVAIMGIIASIATVTYSGHMQKNRIKKVVLEIHEISLAVEAYYNDSGAYPAALSDVGKDTVLDPWGNQYEYLNIATSPVGQVRKDQFLVPINSDFDLYSMGEDGDSKPPLTAAASKDDIIRANDGKYVGPATGY